ncbi:MAG: hypothetical protein ACREQ5_26630, partial [Candidatus Dormibacteria bacterium]
MRRKLALAGLAALALAISGSPAARGVPSAGQIFEQGKAAWRARNPAPFVRYNVLERYTWRDHVHEDWWHVDYRARDRALAFTSITVAAHERASNRGVPILLHLRFHFHAADAGALETNPDADAFPILEPQIVPDDSFGLLPGDPQAQLVGPPDPYGATAAPTPPP